MLLHSHTSSEIHAGYLLGKWELHKPMANWHVCASQLGGRPGTEHARQRGRGICLYSSSFRHSISEMFLLQWWSTALHLFSPFEVLQWKRVKPRLSTVTKSLIIRRDPQPTDSVRCSCSHCLPSVHPASTFQKSFFFKEQVRDVVANVTPQVWYTQCPSASRRSSQWVPWISAVTGLE